MIRRWLAPEVVQTSEMDCGPAALKSLISGFGGDLAYGRLREACQTDVDGTSIDTLEDLGKRLGLDGEQVLVPPEDVLAAGLGHLPCIAVVRLPEGEPHFVVLWRRVGPLVQVMDPAFGRRWIATRRARAELYVHTTAIPAEVWRAWAEGDAFGRRLAARLGALGVRAAAELVDGARATPGWRSLATLDAVARLAGELAASGALRRARAPALVARLLRACAAAEDPRTVVPEPWWTAQPAPERPSEGADAELLVRGAVLVRARGFDPGRPARAQDAELSRELAAALGEREPRPALVLLRAATQSGWGAPLALAVGLALAAFGLVVESLLLRVLLDVGGRLGVPGQRLFALAAVLAFLVGLLALELPLAGWIQRLARGLETDLRMRFLAKLPRIEPRYFKSRPASDMAERAHAVHRVRDVISFGAVLWRALAEVAALTVGLIWLAPASAALALALAAACVLPPLAMQGPLAERDLRVRTHNGSLSRFQLDALLGSVPIAAHGAERALRRAHEGLLVQWVRASRSALSAATVFSALQAVLVHALAAWLVLAEVARHRDPAGALLLVLWVLTLLWLAEPIGMVARTWPSLRNATLRLLEPLGVPEDDSAPAGAADGLAAGTGGVAVEARDVGVVAAGNAVLGGVSLSLAAGEHAAIVGASGAGKSTLCGLLLGLQRPTSGSLHVDGAELAGARIAALRRRTAWVDAEVQLWNRSLAENVRYGSYEAGGASLAELCEAVELHALLSQLPEGLRTPLGESGALVSGGEGQRVRLARALASGSGARLAVLDEPFRGLDRGQRARLLERAREHWSAATMLYVTHDLEEARAFPRVLVFADGRLVEDGAPAALEREAGSRFRALLEAGRASAAAGANRTWRKLRIEGGRIVEGDRVGPSDRVLEDGRIAEAERCAV